MKYTNSPVAFLCFFLGVALTSLIPIVSADGDDPFNCTADYVPEKPIDNFQLKTVGVGGVSNLDANQDQDDEPSPVRVYLNKSGMTVHLFYEGHPEHVLETDLVDVTLYAASDASGVSSGRRRMDDRKVKFDSVSPTAGITSSFKGEDDVLKRHHSLSAASDASGVSSDRRRVDDRSVTFDSVSPTAGIASSFKGEDEVLKRRHSLSAASDALGVSSDRRRVDDRSVTFDSVSPTAGIASSFKGEDDNTIFAHPNIRGLAARCSDSGSGDEHGGDCSATPTYCESGGFGGDNVVGCRCEGPWFDFEYIPVEYSDKARTCYVPEKSCSEEVFEEFPDWCMSNYMDIFGGCRGGCSGTNNCLNLDFHCAEGEYCEMSCTGTNSCNGLTMHCADNQGCELKCHASSRNPMCVGAKVICGDGTVAQGFKCVPKDQSEDCDIERTPPSTDAPSTPPSDVQTATSSAGTPLPCGENGEALPSILYNVNLVLYNDDNYNGFFTQMDASQCYPRTTNGVVAQAEIIMTENPFDSDLASLIYDGSLGTNGGQLKFCARIAYSIGDDDDKELISYIDTKVVLDVSIAADIKFTQAVDISSDQAPVNTVNQDVSAVIDVDSFLCGDPAGDNGGAPYAEDYSLGQAFRVCVDVKTDDQDKFRLANFKEVTCSPDSTDSESTTIIRLDEGNSEPAATSILTSLFDNAATEGAKSFGSSPTVASAQAISFSTVLTNAYFTGEAETLACTGSVDVESMAAEITQGRQLVSFTVPNPSASSSSSRRRMEEETGAVAVAADFGATIKLSSSSSSVTASGLFPLWATTTTLAIALVVGWSL